MTALTTAGPAEVQLPGEQVGQGVDRGDEVGHQVDRDGQDQQREAGQHQQRACSGWSATMSVGLSMIVPLILNWPPARTTTMAPKNSMLIGMPQKLPRTIAVLRLGAAGEVAEVQHERAVDGHPQRAAGEDLPPHLAAGQRVRRIDQAMVAAGAR